jgi:hypothetical protein
MPIGWWFEWLVVRDSSATNHQLPTTNHQLIVRFAYNGPMLDGARFLSADQFLLTTLIVKLAVMAVLATMLVRYHRFRHILIFERRGWLDRLVFTLALGIP